VGAQAENHTHKKNASVFVCMILNLLFKARWRALNSKFFLRGLHAGSGGISSSRA
jgi:hypothetical protein